MAEAAEGFSDGLTVMQRKFCQVYMVTGNKVLAVKESGSKSINPNLTAYNWLRKPRVKAYLLHLHGEVEKEVVLTNAELRDQTHMLINESIALARAGDPILDKNGTVCKDDKGEIVRRVNVGAMLKGAELKGRAAAMFTDVQKIQDEMERKTDEELFSLIAGALVNPTILEFVAQHDDVVRKVHEFDRRDARARESSERDAAEEAESLSPPSQAGGSSSSGLH
jgi:phage terminase small subunit